MHAHHGRVASDLELLGKSEPLMAFAAASIGAFDNVRINCKAVLRKKCRVYARAHAVANMKRFAHRADILAYAAAGRRHDPDRHSGLPNTEIKQTTRRDGNALTTDNADGCQPLSI